MKRQYTSKLNVLLIVLTLEKLNSIAAFIDTFHSPEFSEDLSSVSLRN